MTSIRLTTAVPGPVKASCVAAQRLTKLRVVCPPLAPPGALNNPELFGPQIVNRTSYSVSINNGENRGYVHWEFGAIRGPEQRLWVFDRSNWADSSPNPPPARMIAKREFFGRLITIYRFPDQDGQLEGHDAAFATEHDISYFVSIHGHTDDDGDIALLLAILARSPAH